MIFMKDVPGKMLLRTAVIFAFLCFSYFGAIKFCYGNSKKLPVTEKLYYDVYWKFIKVGYGTLEIRGMVDLNGRKAYKIYSESQSSPFFDNFFKVRDSNDSWIDVDNFYSLAFEQHISEGKYKRDRRVDYDQIKHTAVNNKGEVFDIPENVLDALAALYKVRITELKPNTVITMSVNSVKKNYNMIIRIHNKEIVKISGKNFNSVVVEPDLQDAGIFINKGSLKIWLSDDESHIPVKMQSKIAVGSIMAELK